MTSVRLESVGGEDAKNGVSSSCVTLIETGIVTSCGSEFCAPPLSITPIEK